MLFEEKAITNQILSQVISIITSFLKICYICIMEVSNDWFGNNELCNKEEFFIYACVINSLGHFEHTEQANTPEHRHPQWWHHFSMCQNNFTNTSNHNKAVKAVEEWNKITLRKKNQHISQLICISKIHHKLLHMKELTSKFCSTKIYSLQMV